MTSGLDSEIVAALKEFRGGAFDLPLLQKWVVTNEDNLRRYVSAGVILKLKRGDMQQVMKEMASLVPSCADCIGICFRGTFSSRQDFEECSTRIARSVKKGSIIKIARPKWFCPSDKHFGADGYFKCATCDAIWTLVLPEREDNGLWDRLV